MGHASGVCRSDRRTQNRELKKSDQEERPPAPAASTALSRRCISLGQVSITVGRNSGRTGAEPVLRPTSR